MNSATAASAGPWSRAWSKTWSRAVWRHPEWWALGLCAVAWLWLLRGSAHHANMRGFGAAMSAWLVMTVAMMMPMVVDPIRATAERSFWHRRDRAIALFLLGYLGCWMTAGIAAAFIHVMNPLAPAVAFAIAGAWQLTGAKRFGLAGCHRLMPLAPRGWPADRDCLTYGWWIGTRCLISCWALMLACVLTHHALPAMLLLTGIGLYERYAMRADPRLASAALFSAAAASLALATLR